MRIVSLFSGLLMAGSILSAANGVNSQLLNLAPAGSRVVAGVDVTQAKGSPFGQYILAQMNNTIAGDAGFQQFIDQTGFDPRSDVQQFIVVTNGNKQQANFAVIASAIFDRAKMLTAATAKGATVENFQGVDLLIAKDKHQSNQVNGPGALAFIDTGVVAAGSLDTIHQIIAARAQPSTLDPVLLSQVETMSGSNDAWVVSIVPGADFASSVAPSNSKNLANAQVLQSVMQVSAGVQFGAQVNLSADVLTRTPQDATSLSDVIRFFAGMVEAQQSSDPHAAILAKALANLVLTTKGDDVHAALAFAETDLEQLAQTRHGQHSEKALH